MAFFCGGDCVIEVIGKFAEMLKELDDSQKQPGALKFFVPVVSDVPQPLGEKGGGNLL